MKSSHKSTMEQSLTRACDGILTDQVSLISSVRKVPPSCILFHESKTSLKKSKKSLISLAPLLPLTDLVKQDVC